MPPETEYKKGAGDQTITIQYAGFTPRGGYFFDS